MSLSDGQAWEREHGRGPTTRYIDGYGHEGPNGEHPSTGRWTVYPKKPATWESYTLPPEPPKGNWRDNNEARKERPIATHALDYFPDALAEVARVSLAGNRQHGTTGWDRTKSTDEANTLIRHFIDRGKLDSDGQRHTAKVAWRALAMLQKELEAEREADVLPEPEWGTP